jgi:hypothetical protein
VPADGENAQDQTGRAVAEARGVTSEPATAGRPALDGLKAIIEALVFASPDPVTPKTLFKLLDPEPPEDVEAALAALRADYEHRGGLQLVEIAGGFQIVTRTELHEWVRRLFHERRAQKLSVQALETLAASHQDRGPQAGRGTAVSLCHDARVPDQVRPSRPQRFTQGGGSG